MNDVTARVLPLSLGVPSPGLFAPLSRRFLTSHLYKKMSGKWHSSETYSIVQQLCKCWNSTHISAVTAYMKTIIPPVVLACRVEETRPSY